MIFKKLGDDILAPAPKAVALIDAKNPKFNYYLSSRIKGPLIDLDITTKVFHNDQMFVRKSSYRVKLGQIEKCVKQNLIEHMLLLGLPETEIPDSLKTESFKADVIKNINRRIYSD
ncbi:hypothetical protein [Christiangramia sp. LLG6405-1]|uniref:hypothetical protein n=1 Tax=Christiangramia sp. LLG6405-1 TaxID=3160832 RepID=UPI0038651A68